MFAFVITGTSGCFQEENTEVIAVVFDRDEAVNRVEKEWATDYYDEVTATLYSKNDMPPWSYAREV